MHKLELENQANKTKILYPKHDFFILKTQTIWSISEISVYENLYKIAI